VCRRHDFENNQATIWEAVPTEILGRNACAVTRKIHRTRIVAPVTARAETVGKHARRLAPIRMAILRPPHRGVRRWGLVSLTPTASHRPLRQRVLLRAIKAPSSRATSRRHPALPARLLPVRPRSSRSAPPRDRAPSRGRGSVVEARAQMPQMPARNQRARRLRDKSSHIPWT